MGLTHRELGSNATAGVTEALIEGMLTQSRSDDSIRARGKTMRAQRALSPPWVHGSNHR